MGVAGSSVKGLFLCAALLLIPAVGCGDKFNNSDTTSTRATLSGSVSDTLAKPSLKPTGGVGALHSPMSGGVVKVIDSTGTVLGTATIASDGTYSATVEKGDNYVVRATKGNVCLKSFVEKVDADKAVTVDPTSSAIVKTLSKKIGNDNLGEEGGDVSAAIAAQDVSAFLVAIRGDSLLTVIAQAIAADIAANADYSSATVTVGYGSTAGDADANTIAISITITVTITVQSNAPPTPSGVTVTAGDGQATAGWTAVSGAASYNLYYSATSGVAGVKISGITGASYTVTGLTNGITYYFSVSSVNGTLESAGSAQVSATPQAATAAGTLLQVSAGGGHTIALKTDGTISAWGLADSGQLGVDPTGMSTGGYYNTHNQPTPLKITSISSLISVATGSNHTIGLKRDGTVWAWGMNNHGQIGNSTNYEAAFNPNSTPTQVAGLSSIIAISTSGTHNLALKSDGTVWAWGDNELGQLGNGTTIQSYAPVQVSGLDSVIAIASGGHHSIALKSDGTVWTWGDNWYGELGGGIIGIVLTPVKIAITSVKAIAAGAFHTFAIKNDNTLWAWGANEYGQLGLGTATPIVTANGIFTPTYVDVENVLDVKAGHSFSAILKTDGTVWTCGNNFVGELGYDTGGVTINPLFKQVTGISSAAKISSGTSNMMAVKNDGIVWAWGGNFLGQLGDGTLTDRSAPVQVTGF